MGKHPKDKTPFVGRQIMVSILPPGVSGFRNPVWYRDSEYPTHLNRLKVLERHGVKGPDMFPQLLLLSREEYPDNPPNPIYISRMIRVAGLGSDFVSSAEGRVPVVYCPTRPTCECTRRHLIHVERGEGSTLVDPSPLPTSPYNAHFVDDFQCSIFTVSTQSSGPSRRGFTVQEG